MLQDCLQPVIPNSTSACPLMNPTAFPERPQVVDALLSGTHEPGTSHYELLRAFLTDAELARLTPELNMREYHTHEFGDSVLVSRTFNKLAEDKPRCRIPMSDS